MNKLKFQLFALFFICLFLAAVPAPAQTFSNDFTAIDIPMEKGGVKPNVRICPKGAETVALFLKAWEKQDYRSMYGLLDDESRKKYPEEETIFYFRLLERKPYRLSQVRENGENFDFFLTDGEWSDGDKTLKKLVISGKNFKIIMRKKMSPFADSVEENL